MGYGTRTLVESSVSGAPNSGSLIKKDSIMVHQSRGLVSLSSSRDMQSSSLTLSSQKKISSNRASKQLLETRHEESKVVTGPNYGGMYRHESERNDRLGKLIKSKRERQPNGQKKRLPHKVTFCDQLQQEDVRRPLEEVILVESYKKYNLDTNYNDHGCCTIF